MLFNFTGMVLVLRCFPLHSSKTGLVKSDDFDKLSWSWYLHSGLGSGSQICCLIRWRTSRTQLAVKSSSPAYVRKSHGGLEMLRFHDWKLSSDSFICKASFSKEFAEAITLDLRRSTVCLLGKLV